MSRHLHPALCSILGGPSAWRQWVSNVGMDSRLRDLAPWGLAGLVVVLLLIPLPVGMLEQRWPRLIQELESFGHPLMFGWLAHLVFVRLRMRKQGPWPWLYLQILAGALLFGLATEAAQALIGRDSSWADLRMDMLGAAFALSLHARQEFRASPARLSCTLVAIVTGGLSIAPVATTSAAYAYRSARMPVLWSAQAPMSHFFSYWQGGLFPGLVIDEPAPDWRPYKFLELDIEGAVPGPSHVIVRVNDIAHDHRYTDRYNERFELEPGARITLRIPVERIREAPAGRTMDMGMIRSVVVFSAARHQPPQFTLHEVRLH